MTNIIAFPFPPTHRWVALINLADANEAEERGDKDKAEKLYAKSGFWRDRYNKLKGDA